MIKRLLILLLSLSCMAASGQGVQYRSSLVRKLDAKSHTVGNLGNRTVVREYDEKGRMTNIGLDVFAYDMSDVIPQEIEAFIKRYFLELICWDETTMQQKMYDDKVVFSKGAPHDILRLDTSCDFNLGLRDYREYTATWSKDGRSILSFSFPIECELILGMPQSEVELLLQEDLTSAGAPQAINEGRVEQLEGGIYRTIPVENYYMKTLVNSRYYYKTSSEELRPVFSSNYLMESAANLFQMAMERDYHISVRQSVYGFKKREYQISTSQWVAYCQEQNLITYFAVEKEDTDSIQALIIAESRDLAYNHMLSVVIPKSFTRNKSVVFKAKLNAYIPTHNVSDLYQQYKAK